MIRLRTTSPGDTREVGAATASVVAAGDVVLLSGELGAGKTVFAQGFARALGVSDAVTSPTFTLVHTYRGRLPVVHADLYRLDSTEEVADLALGELLDDGGVALVEWGETAGGVLGDDHLIVEIDYGDGDDTRLVRISAVGRSWPARLGRLEAALARWCVA